MSAQAWGCWTRENLILDLPFKGDRNYLRLADIFRALVEMALERFGPQAQVDSLTIRRPLNSAILLTFERPGGFSGSFRVRSGGESIPGWLVETHKPVTRIPFNMPSVSAVSVSGPGFARVLEPLQGRAMLDIVVALMKIVAGHIDPRQWWLCQLNLDTPLTDVFPIEVRIGHRLGKRFVVFDIVQCSVMIGSARCILEIADS